MIQPIHFYLLGAFIVAMIIANIVLPNILLISHKKRLFDMPDKRKVHHAPVPRLGGLSFFPVMLITMGGSKEILEKLRANMRDNAIWHDVNAVKNNRVYQLPPSLFTVNPGTHTIDAMKIMKEYMYGEAK